MASEVGGMRAIAGILVVCSMAVAEVLGRTRRQSIWRQQRLATSLMTRVTLRMVLLIAHKQPLILRSRRREILDIGLL